MDRGDIMRLSIALITLLVLSPVVLSWNKEGQAIPFSLQSIIVFVSAYFLALRQFLVVVFLYLIIGILGLPVFAESTSGWNKLIGPSGGFLYGFIISGGFISFFVKKEAKNFKNKLVLFFIATIILFFFGLAHLSIKFGFEKALEYGLYPFWGMALIKVLICSLLAVSIEYLLRIPNSDN